MNLPAIPTDNLYKFMTVLGIVMIAFSHWSMTTQTNENLIAVASLAARSDFAKWKTEGLGRQVERLEQIEAPTSPESEPSLQFAARVNEIRAELASLLNEMEQINQVQAVEGAKIANTRGSLFVLKITYFLGILMTALGGTFWYFNFQRFQDRLVRKQAEDGRAND